MTDSNNEINLTEEAIRDLEVVRSELTDRERESSMSVNDWVDQIKTATVQAHKATRAGVIAEEYKAWLEVAAAALGRAEFVLDKWSEDEQS